MERHLNWCEISDDLVVERFRGPRRKSDAHDPRVGAQRVIEHIALFKVARLELHLRADFADRDVIMHFELCESVSVKNDDLKKNALRPLQRLLNLRDVSSRQLHDVWDGLFGSRRHRLGLALVAARTTPLTPRYAESRR